MIRIKRLETIQIEGTTIAEVQELISVYLKKGYVMDGEIVQSDDEKDTYLYYAYVTIDEFD